MLAAASVPTTIEGLLKERPHLPGVVLAGVCLLILFFVVLPRLASWRRGRGRPVLGPLEVEELLLGSGALVVDLRDLQAFRKGHIRGCLHVPFPELATRLKAPDPDAHRAMVLVAETDELAHRAFDILSARGFSWLYVMRGGMKAWRSASRPVAK